MKPKDLEEAKKEFERLPEETKAGMRLKKEIEHKEGEEALRAQREIKDKERGK